jgi:regulator of sigma E protease
VELLEVMSGSPADRAGLRAGDWVLRANGKAVSSVDDMVRTLVLTGGAELHVVVARGTQLLELSVAPGAERRAA